MGHSRHLTSSKHYHGLTHLQAGCIISTFDHPPSDERGCSAPSAARADWWAGGLEIAESHKLEDQSEDQWIGLRENLQERPIFNRKIYGFL